MGLTRSQLTFMLTSTLVVSLTAMLVMASAYLSEVSYNEATRKNCAQYEKVTEAHLDRVPDGCVPQWFEANGK